MTSLQGDSTQHHTVSVPLACFSCSHAQYRAAAGSGRESHLADDAEAHKYTEPQCYDAYAHRTHSSGRGGIGQTLILHKACFCVLTAPAHFSRILRARVRCLLGCSLSFRNHEGCEAAAVQICCSAIAEFGGEAVEASYCHAGYPISAANAASVTERHRTHLSGCRPPRCRAQDGLTCERHPLPPKPESHVSHVGGLSWANYALTRALRPAAGMYGWRCLTPGPGKAGL